MAETQSGHILLVKQKHKKNVENNQMQMICTLLMFDHLFRLRIHFFYSVFDFPIECPFFSNSPRVDRQNGHYSSIFFNQLSSYWSTYCNWLNCLAKWLSTLSIWEWEKRRSVIFLTTNRDPAFKQHLLDTQFPQVKVHKDHKTQKTSELYSEQE